jgi:hypothetical protein
MNIFFLDKNPSISAAYTNNVHIIKMITESAQLLSTAHRILDGYKESYYCPDKLKMKSRHVLPDSRNGVLFQACHINHPSAVWVRQSSGNYKFLYELYMAYVKEYSRRYPFAIVKGSLQENVHKSSLLSEHLKSFPRNIPEEELKFPDKNFQAMPEKYKNVDPIKAYRDYYIGEKKLDNYYIRDISYNNKGKPVFRRKMIGIPAFIFGWVESI